MKKILLFLLLLPMMAGAQNYQTTVDGITYTNYSGYDAGVMYSSNLTGDVVIPKTVKFQLDQTRIYTWTVRKIYSGAFSGCTAQSIFIPSTITSIQSGAFGYYELASIVLEDGNTVYDSRDNCNAIIETATNILVAGCKNTVIPNSVTKIGKRAFSGCIGLTSITIPNSVTTMEDYAFAGCSDLTSVKVESATPITISSESFYNCPNAILYVPVGSKDDYETATGWKDFKEIVEYAAPADGIQFADANVKALCVANWDTNGDGELSEDEAAAVTDLGNVFNGNHEITSFNELQYFWGLQCNDQDLSGNTYSGIPYFAFSGCTNLKQVTLPNVEAIGHAAFSGSGLTAITIPSSVRMIGDEAFYNTNISEFVLPASVTDLCDGYDVAGIISSPNLKSIVVESGNSVYDSRDNCNAIVRTASNQLINGCSTTTIPGTVTSIRQYAFMGCQGLTAITIPISVTSIGGYAFEGCNNLTSVTVENPLPFTIGNGAFSNCANATLHVPAGSKAAYKDAVGWKDFKEIVEPIVPGSAEAPFTCAEAIAFVSGLTADTPTETEYYVKGKVSKMQYNYSYQYGNATFWISDDGTDNGSFYVYRTLYYNKEKYNGGRVPNIGDEVVLCGQMVNYKGTTPETYVNQCRLVLLNDKTVGTGLEVGDLFVAKTPEDVEMFFVVDKTGMSLGKTTVTGCSVGYAVANRPETYTNAPACINSNYEGPITIPETVEGLPVQAVAPSAFAGAKLTSVVIPSTVWDIETNAFKDCQNLASVKMPENVILNTGTFKNCTSLTSVELPKGVQLWAMDIIFSGCTNLTAITVNDETPYELQGNYLVDDPSSVTLYVPIGSKAAYEAADYWKDFKEIIEGTPEVNWTNLVANSDMEGTDVSCFFSKEAGKDVDPVSSTIVDDAGKDGSRGIVVTSSDNPEYSWDTQFFVRLPKALPAGTRYRVKFDYKASQNAEVSTQMHTEPGGYIHWEGIGSPNFTTEWQTYEHVDVISVEQSPEDNMQTIAFNLSESNTATTYYFDNIVFEIDEDHILQVAAVKTHPVGKILSYTGEPQQLIIPGATDDGTMLYQLNWSGFSEEIPTATESGSYTIEYKASGGEGYIDSKTYTVTAGILPAQMTDLVINGDMEGDDMTCFFSREHFFEDETVVPCTIVEGAGKDGSRGVVINTVDNPAEVWDTQFFVRLTKPLPAGTTYYVKFDYKASQEAEIGTEAHSEPGKYIYWEGIGTLNFTTGWQTYEHVGTISAEQSPEDNMQTIAFSLSKPQTATTYYFDNFVFEIDSNQPILFASEYTKQMCVSAFDTNGDGELSEAEAAAVTDEQFKTLLHGTGEAPESMSFDELQYFTGLTVIPQGRFNGVAYLTSIIIPENVTTIEYAAFNGCTKLSSVSLPSGLKSIGEAAFSKVPVSSITIPKQVETIGDRAFLNSGLETVTFKGEKVELGALCFQNSKNLKTVVLPSKQENLPDYIFRGCTSLENITLPNTLKTLGKEAFRKSGLTSITIPAGVEEIPDSCFKECASLSSVDLTNVTKIDGGAFHSTAITSLVLPESVKELGDEAFACTPINTVDLGKIEKIGIGTFISTAIEELTVPATLTETGYETFSWNFSMTKATFEKGCTKVFETMFHGNEKLSEVHLPNTIMEIQDRAFQSCTSLTSIILPATVTKIGEQAFNNCTALVNVTAENLTPVAITEEVFSNRANATLYVPEGCVAAYKAADYWKEFGTIMSYGGSSLYAEDLQTLPGTTAVLAVNLDNVDKAIACKFDLRLPAGVTVATTSNGKLDATLTERAENHSISSHLDNGDYSFVITSLDNDLFTGHSGALVEIKLDIPSTMECGDYTVQVFNTDLTALRDNTPTNVKLDDMDSKLTVTYMPGDVNCDGSVSVTDVGCTINYILKKVPEVFVKDAADMDGDNEITVTDVTRIIAFILDDDASMAPRRSGYDPVIPHLSLQQTADGYALTMDNKDAFVGFQFDVELSAGATVNSMQLNSNSDHLLTYRRLDNGMYRVVCYSLSNSTFADNETPLLNMSVTGDVSVTSVLLTTAGLTGLRATVSDDQSTGVASMNQGLQMSVQGRTLQIVADRDVTLRLYTTGGSVYRVLNVHSGVNTFEGLKAGVYMIENRKMIIR